MSRSDVLLRQYRELVGRNPLFKYEPHRKQAEFHASKAPIKLFLGGNRSGKTVGGVLDDIIQAVDWEVVPEALQPYKKWTPPFHCWIVARGFDVLEGVIYEKLRYWLPLEQLVGGKWDTQSFDKVNRVLRFENGSWIGFKSQDQDVAKFSGAALHRVHYDEEPPKDIRVECRYRLLDYAGADELFTMTPLLGMSWMYDTFWEPHTKGLLNSDVSMTLVDMDENPYLDADQKRRALADASPEERKARKEGRFVHFAGMIYDEFSRRDHVLPEDEVLPVPEGARVFVGVDPGIRHMAAVVWAYLTADDTLVVFEELAARSMTIAQVCGAIQRINEHHKVRPDWYVIDPAARNVLHQTGRSDQMEYADHGIVTIAGQNAVTAGINRVKERLLYRRLQVGANCVTLIDEFRKYRWRTPSRSENDPKEEPVKSDDHLLDALRYLVMSRPQPPEARREDRFETPLERAAREEMEGRRPVHRRLPRAPHGGGVFA